MRDGNARGFELAPALPFRTETAGVRLESGAIKRLCDFPQLPLAAASIECASHQQDRPWHQNSISALHPRVGKRRNRTATARKRNHERRELRKTEPGAGQFLISFAVR